MILSCNSCDKKFVVPDNAIGANGRLVQCSSCGNKWTQFPIDNKTKTKKEISKIKSAPKKIKSPNKITKKNIKKRTGPNLYSPEYLEKKHGIKIDEKPTVKNKITKNKDKATISFGFYSFLVVSIVISISILRILYFAQDFIVDKFPFSEIYINYLFESIRNVIEIIQNFVAGY